jgi:stage 0 sporulation regulatory protein
MLLPKIKHFMGTFVRGISIIPNFLHNIACEKIFITPNGWVNRGINIMFTENAELEDRINQLKKELILITKATGLNSHDTICCSQKLDQLITIYQRHLQHSCRKRVHQGYHQRLDEHFKHPVSI